MNETESEKINENPEKYCWATGIYASICNCELCEHKDECSGYNGAE